MLGDVIDFPPKFCRNVPRSLPSKHESGAATEGTGNYCTYIHSPCFHQLVTYGQVFLRDITDNGALQGWCGQDYWRHLSERASPSAVFPNGQRGLTAPLGIAAFISAPRHRGSKIY